MVSLLASMSCQPASLGSPKPISVRNPGGRVPTIEHRCTKQIRWQRNHRQWLRGDRAYTAQWRRSGFRAT